jgi:hypothetical protein
MSAVHLREQKRFRIVLIFAAAVIVTGLLMSSALGHETVNSKGEETNRIGFGCKIGDGGAGLNHEACTLAACMGDHRCLNRFYGKDFVALSVMEQVHKDHDLEREYSSPDDNYIQKDYNECLDTHIANINSNGFDSKEAVEAVDGDYDTKWTENGYGSFLQVDLGKPEQVCSLDIVWFNGHERIYNFMISISKDGTTFTDVLKGVSTGVTRAPENYDLPSSANIDVRFIRITVFGNVDGDNNSKTSSEAAISEIKLFTEPSS